jgi:cobalt-zinc-cadmium efflux system outer membrane protein
MAMWRFWARFAAALAAAVAIEGCRAPRQVRDADYAAVVSASYQAAESPRPQAEAVPPTVDRLAGPQPVEVYIEYALSQNPEIEAARKRVDAMADRVPQAASLNDPTVSLMGFPFYPAVPQTAAGRITTSVSASQQVPWLGKLRARAESAEAAAEAARAQLAAAELAVIEQVKRAYYELYFFQKAIQITEEDRRLLLDLTRIAEARYRTGKVSQQDVLRAQVEVSNLDSELIRLRQEQISARARLAQLLHVSPETPVAAEERLSGEEIPRDVERLYEAAVAARPELQAQLAMVRRDRRQVELARLAYYPDLNFTVDWAAMTRSGAISPIADGIDDVGIGVMLNVPIYRKRLAAGVREAEAQTVADARQFDSLRDGTVQQVKDLFVQAASQEELVKLFHDDIIPRADQTLKASTSAYEVGTTDFLQLVDNWRQLLRFRIAYHRLEAQLRQSLASLERVVGGQLARGVGPETAPKAPNARPEAPAPKNPAAGPPMPPER